ncbi:DgyrCDS2220 [Dimorphilus gyrociliatus]|uniref:NADH dehydrogenase [ubiquinone] 1 beta subcomplex subunit 10 n=1 Tax=Dimorphilus gyrociliatus TaxID=2664684 RepID=A0A7I8V9K8_9ANNE|nr:DgyrCDS2220 [Dimorphilus gyrociliatus]
MDDDRLYKAAMEQGSIFNKAIYYIFNIIEKPAKVFREKIVEPMRSEERPKYYHRRYQRVPDVGECRVGDQVCIHEANEQFKRDRQVDANILNILHERQLECEFYYGPYTPDANEKCKHLREQWEVAAGNFFTKYGDLGMTGSVVDAFMKQKHRMIWERRHGPVGSGMKQAEKEGQ